MTALNWCCGAAQHWARSTNAGSSNEINKLIWPSPAGIGIMDEARWAQTVAVAIEGRVISEPPAADAYRTDLAQAALDSLKTAGFDVTGESWEPLEVALRPGGE